MKTVRYTFFCAALLAMTACGKDTPPAGGEKIPLNMVSLGMTAMGDGRTRAVVATDPTTTPPGDRTGQTLAVSIGSASADYAYDAGSGKWLPVAAAVSFPDNDPADVDFILSDGTSDPIAAQDGTQNALLAADVLTGSLTNAVPAGELSVQLRHANTLLDITLSGAGFDLTKVSGVAAGSSDACNIPDSASAPTANWQVIIAPGAATSTISVTYNGLNYRSTVAPATPAVAFAAHTRYRVSLVLEGGVLVCGGVWVTPWDEGAGGDGQQV